jgi:hypothetical protein
MVSGQFFFSLVFLWKLLVLWGVFKMFKNGSLILILKKTQNQWFSDVKYLLPMESMIINEIKYPPNTAMYKTDTGFLHP